MRIMPAVVFVVLLICLVLFFTCGLLPLNCSVVFVFVKLLIDGVGLAFKSLAIGPLRYQKIISC